VALPIAPARQRVKSGINGLSSLPPRRGHLSSSLAASPRGSHGPLKHPFAFGVGPPHSTALQNVIGQGSKGFSFVANEQVAQIPTKALRAELKAKGVVLPGLAALQDLAKSFHDGFEAFLVRSASRRSGTSWYTIFKEADADGSGAVALDEFRRVARRVIGLSQSNLSDDALKALWCALDVDDSNGVPYDELKNFLKLYTPRVRTGPRWVGATQELHGRGADTGFSFIAHGEQLAQVPTTSMRAELEAKGVALPDAERLDRLSRTFNERLEEARTKALGNQATQTRVSWIQLFRQIDKDGSGFITYDEMTEMARRRDKLRLLRSEISDDQLKALCKLCTPPEPKSLDGAALTRSPRREPTLTKPILPNCFAATRPQGARSTWTTQTS
jgi:Ca2+-binding EF-hand superfamily protein